MLRKIDISPRSGFTILEVLVASTVLVILLGIMLTVVDSARNMHRRSMATIKAFREGRQALDVVSTALSQATLNTYLDYVDSSGKYRFATGGNATTFVPAAYKRSLRAALPERESRRGRDRKPHRAICLLSSATGLGGRYQLHRTGKPVEHRLVFTSNSAVTPINGLIFSPACPDPGSPPTVTDSGRRSSLRKASRSTNTPLETNPTTARHGSPTL
jgi:prepilin-type N-terminal cleavage/methylation domain-containing protein